MKTKLKSLIIWTVLFYQLAALELPKVISSGMVLQREMQVPIWGRGYAGEKVVVTFAEQIQNGIVDSEGKWMIRRLKPMEASSENRIMKIQVGSETVQLKDVVVGEVWMCSGQSNMGWTIGQSSVKTKNPALQAVPDWISQHKKTARDPMLRRFSVGQVTSYKEEKFNIEVNPWNSKGLWISADSEKHIERFSGVAYFFGLELRRELGVPIGLLQTPWGGKKIQPFIPSSAYKKSPKLKTVYEKAWSGLQAKHSKVNVDEEQGKYEAAMLQWEKDVKVARSNKVKLPPKPQKWHDPRQDANFPSTIYNAMVNPLVPYAIKGALWYQGEANQGDSSASYQEYLTALISGWRERWGQGDFPFYFSQLAGFKKPAYEPLRLDNWAKINNEMRLSLELHQTGMAVTYDIGEEKDIHPRNKVDVGKRLSRWALAKDYGRKELVYSGPLYKSHILEGNKYTITFSSVGEGLMIARKKLLEPAKQVSEDLGGFQISDDQGKWVWAKAKIIGKDKVEAYHPEIQEPKELRYAWAANPVKANLYNKAGLPASLFSTLE